MANIDIPASGSNYVATNTTTRDGQTEHMQCMNLVDLSCNDAVGVNNTGVSQPSGGSGILGWLSGIYKTLTGILNVNVEGVKYYLVTDNSAHTIPGAVALVGFENLDPNPQTFAIQAWDNTVASGTLLSAPFKLGSQEIITYPLGGKTVNTGLTVQVVAGAPATGIHVLYR